MVVLVLSAVCVGLKPMIVKLILESKATVGEAKAGLLRYLGASQWS